jgi:hypothetical protein
MFSNDGAERVLRTVYEGQPFDLGFDRGGARGASEPTEQMVGVQLSGNENRNHLIEYR